MYKTCDICKKVFKYPYLLKRHNDRKFPCKEALHPSASLSIPEHPSASLSILVESKKIVNCKYCNLEIRKSNLKRHYRNSCNSIPKQIKENLISNFNKTSKTKLISNKSNINHTNNTNHINNINNGTINNNNITIKINPFGQEDISFISKKDKLNLLQKKYMGVPELIKLIHDNPSNHNFFMPNVNKKIMAYLNKDNKLEYDNYNEICDQIIEDNIQRLDLFYNELEEELTSSIKTRLKQIIEDNNSGNINTKYMNDIKYYLINITKRNKKEINDYLNMIEQKLATNGLEE